MGIFHRLGIRRRLSLQLLAATSIFGLAVYLAPGARADEFDRTASHIAITGGYLFNDSSSDSQFDDKLGHAISADPGRDGEQVGVELGFRFNPMWDWRISGNAVFLDRDHDKTPNQSISNDLDFQYFDVEFGYHPPEMPNLRLFAGLRVLDTEQKVSYDDKLGDFNSESDFLGIGPRAGVDAIFPLGDSIFSIKARGAGSVLFGDITRDVHNSFLGSSNEFSDTDPRTVFNLEGSAALSIRLGENATLDVGYRAQQWWDLIDEYHGNDLFGNIDKGDVFVHGPFATFTVDLP